MAVYMWLCVKLCVHPCRVSATRHVCVGVTVRDLADVGLGVRVNVGVWLQGSDGGGV